MTRAEEVSLRRATPSDGALLANLLELYSHDLSAVFPNVELGPDGRFGYPKLERYWSEPARYFAFVIQAEGRSVGFALATRGSPAADDPDVLDVAEFFVLRRYRRSGVGRRAAALLFGALPGAWTVRVSERNARAMPFWASVVRAAATSGVTELESPGRLQGWRVFCFECRQA